MGGGHTAVSHLAKGVTARSLAILQVLKSLSELWDQGVCLALSFVSSATPAYTTLYQHNQPALPVNTADTTTPRGNLALVMKLIRGSGPPPPG